MAQRTGHYTISDLLAARFTSAKEFGMDNIQQVLAAELDAHNTLMVQALAELAEPTSDAQSIYGSATGGTMVEVDEHGQAPTQKESPGSTVGFPLKLKQFNIGWTETYFLVATPADMAIKMQNAQIAHRREVLLDLKRAIFGSANYSFRDHLVDNISVTVRRFLNADGEPIPAGPNGETYAGGSETHYTAEASLTAANLTASIRNVVEKGHGTQVKTAIALANEAAVRALTGFTPYVDARLRPTEGDPVTTVDHTRIDNRAIGILDASEVWVKPWAITGYAFTWDAGSSNKPLKYRQQSASALQGLRIAAELSSHPLHAQMMEARYGFGVWTRTNGAVHQFTNGTYQNPTI